jgi:hypothetical protein
MLAVAPKLRKKTVGKYCWAFSPAVSARYQQITFESGVKMDRLLFGDNQFFGVNHMSEEKARAQAMRFQDIQAVIEVLDNALDEGVKSFMCTTHDRIALVCDHMRANPARYQNFEFMPCMPYAHKYANAVTEDGILGTLKRFMPDEGFPECRRAWRHVAGQEGHRGRDHAADRCRDEDVRRPQDAGHLFAERGGRPAAGHGLQAAFRIFADHVKARYNAEPGFITMNMPMLLDVLEELGIENPIVCSNINKIGFRMCGGFEAYEKALREKKFRAIAMSVFASGAIPPKGSH